MPIGSRATWIVVLALSAVITVGGSAFAGSRCDQLLARLGNQVVNAADTTCFESSDLTTANPNTTPADNSLAGLPASRLPRKLIAP